MQDNSTRSKRISVIKQAAEKKKSLQRRCESVKIDPKYHSRQISSLIKKQSIGESVAGIYEVSENGTLENSDEDSNGRNGGGL